MQELKVIGVEEGALLAADNDGDRYRIPIDEVALTKLRRLKVEQQDAGVRISPREIQAHIRGGLSAEEVAELTGAALDYVQRFERPIIAEREHIVAQALAVPVRIPADVDVIGENATFGAAIRERLGSLGAVGERWASWREDDGGWIVKLSFTADDIEHDARWSYEPRKAHLAPANAEASTLSQQGELPPTGLIPRLRAVTPITGEDGRFDSSQFEFVEPRRDAAPAPTPATGPAHAAAHPTAHNAGGHSAAAHNAATQNASAHNATAQTAQLPVGAVKRADDEQPRDVHNTADLLEALRRRRGEREAASLRDSQPLELELGMPTTEDHRPETASPETPPPSPAPAPLSVHAGGYSQRETGPLGTRSSAKRGGRASMPSWDEIVFGARGDDDTSA